jgi:Fur family transcriptional regulator, ferric uptake regulator
VTAGAGSVEAVAGPPDVDEVLDLVRRRGGRVTGSRRAVITALLRGRGEHLTAEDVAARVQTTHPDVHLSTVYRTLEALEELGVASHVHLGHGPSTYHLAVERHHHAVCDGCGDVVELPADLFDEVAERVGATTGFVIDPAHFALPGRCRACAEGAVPPSG